MCKPFTSSNERMGDQAGGNTVSVQNLSTNNECSPIRTRYGTGIVESRESVVASSSTVSNGTGIVGAGVYDESAWRDWANRARATGLNTLRNKPYAIGLNPGAAPAAGVVPENPCSFRDSHQTRCALSTSSGSKPIRPTEAMQAGEDPSPECVRQDEAQASGREGKITELVDRVAVESSHADERKDVPADVSSGSQSGIEAETGRSMSPSSSLSSSRISWSDPMLDSAEAVAARNISVMNNRIVGARRRKRTGSGLGLPRAGAPSPPRGQVSVRRPWARCGAHPPRQIADGVGEMGAYRKQPSGDVSAFTSRARDALNPHRVNFPGNRAASAPGGGDAGAGAGAGAGAAGKAKRLRWQPTYLTVKAVFFLFYSSLGAIMPYLPVYYHSLNLKDR